VNILVILRYGGDSHIQDVAGDNGIAETDYIFKGVLFLMG
jgi:hypothetical protein